MNCQRLPSTTSWSMFWDSHSSDYEKNLLGCYAVNWQSPKRLLGLLDPKDKDMVPPPNICDYVKIIYTNNCTSYWKYKMLKFALKYLTFAPTCFGPPDPSSGMLCSMRLLWVACCTAPSTHFTTWNTWCHNTAKLITMYFNWLILQKCNFSQAHCKLPEDGPGGPKHVGANIRYFNVNFNILCV